MPAFDCFTLVFKVFFRIFVYFLPNCNLGRLYKEMKKKIEKAHLVMQCLEAQNKQVTEAKVTDRRQRVSSIILNQYKIYISKTFKIS